MREFYETKSYLLNISEPPFFLQMTLKIPLLRAKAYFTQHHLAFIYPYVFTDIDECSDGSHTCSSYATCTDTIGSYTCKCPDKGFKGDGHKCTGLGNE